MKNTILFVSVIMLLSSINITFPDGQSNSEETQIDNTSSDISRLESMPEHPIKNPTPSWFVQNLGQLRNDNVRFYDPSGSAWFTNDGLWLNVYKDESSEVDAWNPHNPRDDDEYAVRNREGVILKQEFVGSHISNPEGLQPMDHYTNCFYGNDPTKWRSRIPSFSEVLYRDIYTNIDVKYYISGEGLKYDLIVHPGSDIGQIRICYNGATGVRISDEGSIVIDTPIGSLMDDELFIYQDVDDIPYEVEGRFVLYSESEYGFEVLGNHNENVPLIIDPRIIKSTFVGASKTEHCCGMDFDTSGNIIFTGTTNSPDLPTNPGVYQESKMGLEDVFVMKISSDLTTLLYATYVGGNDLDDPTSISVDENGSAYITGTTGSNGFPVTTGAYDTSFNGGGDDAFAFKLNPNATNLSYSTFIGGNDYDSGNALSIDSNNNAIVSGVTFSLNFQYTPGAYKSMTNVDGVAYVLKLNHNGTSAIFSTALGKGHPLDMLIDEELNLIIAGRTNYASYPTTPGAFDRQIDGPSDSFVTKLYANGTNIYWSTLLGGSDTDKARSLHMDSQGILYITGTTKSSDFPVTPNAYSTVLKDNREGYVAIMNANVSILTSATYFPGALPLGITFNNEDKVIITGDTLGGIPTTEGAYQSSHNEYYDAFLAVFTKDLSHLSYSTYLGGQGHDSGRQVNSISSNQVLISGFSGSPLFPTTEGVYQEEKNGSDETFFMYFSLVNNWNISSVNTTENGIPTQTIHARLGNCAIRISTISTALYFDCESIQIILDPSGENIILQWNAEDESFIEFYNPKDMVSLESNCSSENNSNGAWNVKFVISFNWTFPDDELIDMQVCGYSKTLAPAWFNITDAFSVENDLEFIGDLRVADNKDFVISSNNPIRGGSEIKWSGLTTVYQGTSDLYPPDSGYDVSVWAGDKRYWTSSPGTGEELDMVTTTLQETHTTPLLHTVNLTGIPSECDATDVTYGILIDSDNVSFSDSTPLNSTWNDMMSVAVGITISDSGGGKVDGGSIRAAYSKDNGTTWFWEQVPPPNTAKTVTAVYTFAMNDGTENLVKWVSSDTLGNGPMESPEYRVLVDTQQVEFHGLYPADTEVSSSENVPVGVTITDITSGVDGDSVQYAISTDGGTTWSKWIDVDGLSSDSKVVVVALELEFPNGDDNRIKWRAIDVAGNGPTESDDVFIHVQVVTILEDLITNLVSPVDESTTIQSSMWLLWDLEPHPYANVEFDIILDTVDPPVSMKKKGHTEMELLCEGLTDKTTYYWTVNPRIGSESGICRSSVWSFTYNSEAVTPEIDLVSPDDGSVLPTNNTKLVWKAVGESGGWEFDVYFGEDNLPIRPTATSLAVTEYPVSDLKDGKTYHWAVIPISREGVYGDKGASIWSFSLDLTQDIHSYGAEFLPLNDITLFQGEIRQIHAKITSIGDVAADYGFNLSTGLTGDQASLLGYMEATLSPGDPYIVTIQISIARTTPADVYHTELTALCLETGITLHVSVGFNVTVQEFPDSNSDNDKKGKDDGSSSMGVAIAIVLIVIIPIVVLLLLLRRRQPKDETQKVEGVVEEQVNVKWSPMTGTAVIDVVAAKMGPDYEKVRLTKPVEGGSVSVKKKNQTLLLPSDTNKDVKR